MTALLGGMLGWGGGLGTPGWRGTELTQAQGKAWGEGSPPLKASLRSEAAETKGGSWGSGLQTAPGGSGQEPLGLPGITVAAHVRQERNGWDRRAAGFVGLSNRGGGGRKKAASNGIY